MLFYRNYLKDTIHYIPKYQKTSLLIFTSYLHKSGCTKRNFGVIAEKALDI